MKICSFIVYYLTGDSANAVPPT